MRLDRTGVEPEWLVGKIGNREGLFPEAFVQPVDDHAAAAAAAVYDTAPKRFFLLHSASHPWPDFVLLQIRILSLHWPHAGSGVVRIDPLRFLAGCHTRRLNQV